MWCSSTVGAAGCEPEAGALVHRTFTGLTSEPFCVTCSNLALTLHRVAGKNKAARNVRLDLESRPLNQNAGKHLESAAALGVRQAHTWAQELWLTLRLGGPLALGELGWMSTYIVDGLMIGRLPANYSPLAQASALLGNTIYYAIVFSAIYLLNGLETLVAQSFGQDRPDECLHLLGQSAWIVVLATPLVMVSTLGSLLLLPMFGVPHEVVVETGRYLRPLVLSTLPLMLYMALRRYLQSINNVVWVTVSLVTAAAVNWFGDWVFLLGRLGVPSLGIAGSAWGTLVVRVYMLALLAVGGVVATRRLGLRATASMLRPDWPRLHALLRIGWPSGLENLAEFGVSTYMSILCTRLGTILAAAQDVVLNLNAFVYQVPNGLSYATITRVGQAAGRNNRAQVERAANVSLAVGVAFIALAGLVFALFAHFWAALYSNNTQVIAAAAPIFTICAFLLLGDTVFVLLASALTGLGDTRTPMIVSLAWNWGIGMPLGYALAFHHGLALRGLWIGRGTASLGTGITLLIWWRLRLRRERERTSFNLISTFRTAASTSQPATHPF